jgi:hypothetical protein
MVPQGRTVPAPSTIQQYQRLRLRHTLLNVPPPWTTVQYRERVSRRVGYGITTAYGSKHLLKTPQRLCHLLYQSVAQVKMQRWLYIERVFPLLLPAPRAAPLDTK